MTITFNASKSLHGYGIVIWVYDNRNKDNTITYANPNGNEKFTLKLFPGEIDKYWNIENTIYEIMRQHGRASNFWVVLRKILDEKYTILGDEKEMTNTKKLQITFEQAVGELRKYTAKKSDVINRPILKNIYFDGESFIATNSFILLTINKDVVKDIPVNIKEGSLINPKNSELINEDLGKYPNVSKFIPTSCKLKLKFNKLQKEMLKQVRAGNRLIRSKSETKMYRLVLDGSYMSITALKQEEDKREEKYEYTWGSNNVLESDNEQFTTHVNSSYLTTALNTVSRLARISNSDMTLSFSGRLRPTLIQQEGVFNLIILPLRVS